MVSLWGLLWTRKVGTGDFELVVLPMITGGWLVICAVLLQLGMLNSPSSFWIL